jgi:hypothetical protein
VRAQVQAALQGLPIAYVLDEIVRGFKIRRGYLRLKVRDGFVVGAYIGREFGVAPDESEAAVEAGENGAVDDRPRLPAPARERRD